MLFRIIIIPLLPLDKKISQQIYRGIGVVPNSLPDEYLSKINKKYKHLLIKHLKDILNKEATKQFWRISGILSNTAQTLLDSLVSWVKDKKFNNQMINHGGYVCISKLISACIAEELCDDFIETFMMLSNNATIRLHEEKRIVDLDKVGLLPYVILFSSHKDDNISSLGEVIVTRLLSDIKLIKTAFQDGTPCDAALSKTRRDSCGREIDKLLKKLRRKARTSYNVIMDSNLRNITEGIRCNQCSRSDYNSQTYGGDCYNEGYKMLRCSKCKCTYYCSKQCQKKDWTIHKLTCRMGDISQSKSSTYKMMTTMLRRKRKYFKRRFFELFETDYSESLDDESCSEHAVCSRNVTFKNFAIQMDFVDQHFDVVLICDLLKANQLPDWFCNQAESTREFIAGVRTQQSTLLRNQLLVIARFPSCDSCGVVWCGAVCINE